MRLTDFEPDPISPKKDPNVRLGELLDMPWRKLIIIRIDRLTMGSQPGWLVTYEATAS